MQDFAIKKLQVKDLFKLRDRFEGQYYLDKSIKRVLTMKTIMENIKIENRAKLKIGFLNTLDLQIIANINIEYINNREIINSLKNNDNNLIFSFVNIEDRFCVIDTSERTLEKLQVHFTNYIKKFNCGIYD